MDGARHKDRVVLITGAASGIGRATAIRFAAEGARVVATDVDDVGLDETLKEIADAGHDARGIHADIADRAGIVRLVTEVGGPLDVLVNNAGVMDHFRPVTELDDATWDRVLAVNVTAVMRLCRAMLPVMRESGGGAVVNVASIGGLTGWVAGTAYVVSKHAVIGLTRSIAALYADDGIRCNAVCPGGVATNIGATAAPAVDWAFQRLSRSFAKSGEAAKPDEIAALISWLASDEASNVNGAVVTADHGFMA